MKRKFKLIKIFFEILRDKYKKRFTKNQLNQLCKFILNNNIDLDFLIKETQFLKNKQPFYYYIQNLNRIKDRFLSSYRDNNWTINEPIQIKEIINQVLSNKKEA